MSSQPPTDPSESSPPGLTSVDASRRLLTDGPNDLVPPPRSTHLLRLLGPLLDPMVALLLLAAPVYLLIGETTDAVITFVALVPVAGVGWALEARAERTLDDLARLTAPTAVVRRDGVDREVPARDLVVGDVITVREGDVVPADARVVGLTQLSVDESSLTGESLPIDKVTVADDTADAASLILAGTTVLSGRAIAVVTATGTATRYGRIGGLMSVTHTPRTPLQIALARLVRALLVVALAFCITVVTAELLHGRGWGEALIAGVSLAIAAIPEEFTMVYTLYLALGAWRLAQHRALVRRLPSVETLGSTTVICTDKTGTLTEGRLTTSAIWTPHSGVEHVDGRRFGESGTALLEAAVQACERQAFDPLDLAILSMARRHDVDVDALQSGTLVADWPFDPVDRYLTHVWLDTPGENERHAAVKGSIEGVIRHSDISDAARDDALTANEVFTAAGMRVIAVASGAAPRTSADRAEDEAALVFLGLIAFDDPLRPGVRDALAECRAAGIRVVMITGDHPATAHVVAEALDLPHRIGDSDRIATGDVLDDADDAGLDVIAATTNVFARTRPDQKHRLVQALRRRGDVVAMTGDGINDAPALREADIGVAMGERGTDVARSAASLVLLDDNFTTIVNAVGEGRRIFDNLTRAFAYLIAFHPPLLFAAVAVPLLGKPLLLLPVHFVVLELLMHPVVSLVFQADPADPDTMSRPPRPVGESLSLRALARPYALGGAVAIVLVALYLAALARLPEQQARGVGMTALLAVQPGLLLSVRSGARPLWRSGRPWTRTSAVVMAGLLMVVPAVVWIAPLAHLLHLEPFPAPWWLLVMVVGSVPLWSEFTKRCCASEHGRGARRGAEPRRSEWFVSG